MTMRGPIVLLLCVAGLGIGARAQAQGEPEFRVVQAAPDTFAVYRTRADGQSIEGVVIDSSALVDVLRTRVLEEQGLGDLARVSAVRARAPRNGERWPSRSPDEVPFSAAAYSFSHRFAAPFSAIEARLDLAPLEDDGEADLLWPLTLLLTLCIVLGLVALYRMAAVQVRFAQRRHDFVAAVSHELKTPLTAIRMYAEMLGEGMAASEEKRHEYYGVIRAESERLSRLINNVLELGRLERKDPKERDLQLTRTDVGAAVREVIELFRPHALGQGFELDLQCESQALPGRVDRDALTQVLFNLLDNALKYGHAGGERRIDVRCGVAPRLAQIEIAIADRGPGVAKQHLRAIFSPFYRVQSELTRTQKGTGIGLALVRGLVERMGGTVDARNLATGFEVRVRLPLAQG